jgi:uncharacterized protein with LGFP repeats
MTHIAKSNNYFAGVKSVRFKRLLSPVLALLLVLSASTAMAFAVYGLIGDKYRQLGGPGGLMGAPLNDESPAANGGRFNRFQHGYIYWHPSFGAHMVFGAIADKWRVLGLEKSPVGYPTSDEIGTGGGGRRNNFQGGMIVWHPQTGAFAVYGEIGKKWLASGGETGPCGFPTSDEKDGAGYVIRPGVSTRTRVSYFQRGVITWYSNGNITDMKCVASGTPPGPPTSLPGVSCTKGSKWC